MPYLLSVKRNRNTGAGTSSKGYCIWRAGSSVYLEWGAIDVDGKLGGQAYWRGPNLPNERVRRFGSAARAERFKVEKLASLRWRRYDVLPPDRKIKAYRFNPLKRR